jgi:hypothetical protein
MSVNAKTGELWGIFSNSKCAVGRIDTNTGAISYDIPVNCLLTHAVASATIDRFDNSLLLLKISVNQRYFVSGNQTAGATTLYTFDLVAKTLMGSTPVSDTLYYLSYDAAIPRLVGDTINRNII